MKKLRLQNIPQPFHDITITAGLLLATIALAVFWFFFVSRTPINIALFFFVSAATVARYTNRLFYSIFSSVFGAVFINCFFTYPYFKIDFTLPDYPFTFLSMLTISLVSNAIAINKKRQEEFAKLRENQLAEAEKERMRANLLRAVSHDLRTPLTSIIGSISAMEADGSRYTPQDCQELIRNIYDDATWLLNMVENLLSVTKIQAGGSKLATMPQIVDEVVEESVTRLKKRLPEARIDVNVPDEILMVPMDAMMIEQVLINLLENAVVHSKSQQPVQLIVQNQERHVKFRVIDYGNGLSKEQLEHLFDGTYSTAPSADGQKGIGIGLSICHTIITAHKGNILAKNNEKGAEFLFTLPKEESCINLPCSS